MFRKIITVTLNTSIDVIIEVPQFTDNAVLDAESYTRIAAGKGINVAHALAALGEKVLAMGIVGKKSKKDFASVASRRIQTSFVYTEGSTRRNTTVIQKQNGATTHIRSKGYQVNDAIISRIRQKLKSAVDKNDIVVFCGSLPPGAKGGVYGDFTELCVAKGAFTVLDTSGIPLLEAIAANPQMIKLNRAEFQTTFGVSSCDDEQVMLNRMNVLVNNGISYVSVTLGSDGVIVIKENENAAMKVSIDLGPEYANRKVVGSGDASLAGFVYGIKKKLPYNEMVRWGVACGAANVLSKIPGYINIKDVERLMKRVRLEYIQF